MQGLQELLELELVKEAELALESDHVPGVGECVARIGDRPAANGEVQRIYRRPQGKLANYETRRRGRLAGDGATPLRGTERSVCVVGFQDLIPRPIPSARARQYPGQRPYPDLQSRLIGRAQADVRKPRRAATVSSNASQYSM